jgi:hypothetical protein
MLAGISALNIALLFGHKLVPGARQNLLTSSPTPANPFPQRNHNYAPGPIENIDERPFSIENCYAKRPITA